MENSSPPEIGGRATSQTLADRAYDRIADAIVRGELKQGSKITEVMLSERFGISRGPLREALRRLEGRKLVVTRPRAGARVVSLSKKDILEVFEIRQSLEELACRLAAERMSDEQLDRLETLLDLHEENPLIGRGHSRASEKPDFHVAIALGSRNRQLIDLLCGQMFDLIRVYRFQSSSAPGRADRAFQEHREIFSAIRRREPDEAARLMGRHIRQSRLNLLRDGSIDDDLPIELYAT